MTAKEVMEAWYSIGVLGRLSFLFRSRFMNREYPTDDEPFFMALERFKGEAFEDLPEELQNEFGRYAETQGFQQIWLRKGKQDEV